MIQSAENSICVSSIEYGLPMWTTNHSLDRGLLFLLLWNIQGFQK